MTRLSQFGRWLVRGEGAQVRAILGREPIVPSAWYTPWWLGHMCGNAILIGFYVPAIAFCLYLATK